jgi:hypothetical protein
MGKIEVLAQRSRQHGLVGARLEVALGRDDVDLHSAIIPVRAGPVRRLF